MKTYDVIRETEIAYCDIGIIAIKGNDISVMERYLNKMDLSLTPILKASPHVYLRREHPLANKTEIISDDLKSYPYVSYEQGEHNSSFFTEEITNAYSDKQVEISDRASLMNVLLATDCYTIGTGIMPSLLNEGRIVSIPYKDENFYIIGYILHTDRNISGITREFIEMLNEAVKDLK